MADQCVFCDIMRGDSPATFVHQDDTVVAFMDIIVAPREHAVLMSDLNETAAMRTFRVARHMAQTVRDSLGAGGVNLFVADGEVAFQDVPHFHVHVIPRYPNDGFGLTFPRDYTETRSRAELETIASAIRKASGQ
jgi:histidine triad (HIT) family protein